MTTIRREIADVQVCLDLIRQDIARLKADSKAYDDVLTLIVPRLSRIENMVAGMLDRETRA